MSTQRLNIGAAPNEEECAQVGQPDYPEYSQRECLVFMRMLQRLYPVPNAKAWLAVKSFSHEFGSYREVCAYYDNEDAVATEYAFMLERETPLKWDDIANYELLWHAKKTHYAEAARRGEITRDEIPASYLADDFPALPADKTFLELCRMFPL
jgi:hypothetical protein